MLKLSNLRVARSVFLHIQIGLSPSLPPRYWNDVRFAHIHTVIKEITRAHCLPGAKGAIGCRTKQSHGSKFTILLSEHCVAATLCAHSWTALRAVRALQSPPREQDDAVWRQELSGVPACRLRPEPLAALCNLFFCIVGHSRAGAETLFRHQPSGKYSRLQHGGESKRVKTNRPVSLS